jgi:hypothetical protein
MRTTPAVHVQTEIRGDVPKFAAGLAAAKVGSLLRMAPEPVLFARVTLTMAADRAVARPAAVRVNVDLNGRLIHVGAAAATAREAVERMGDRLRIRLERAARNWAVTRGGRRVQVSTSENAYARSPRTACAAFPDPCEPAAASGSGGWAATGTRARAASGWRICIRDTPSP